MEVTDNEKLYYVDINSMYPFIFKNHQEFPMPKGHPTVYADPEEIAKVDITQLFGCE